MVTLRRVAQPARANASRMTRSTPCRVFRLSSVAISAGGVLVQDAAGARVEALGALADHDKVDLARVPTPASGLVDARPQPGRAQVHVLVELEAQLEQQTALEHAGRHARVADRAEQDRVVLGQLAEHRVGQHLAGAVVARGTEVVVGQARHPAAPS